MAPSFIKIIKPGKKVSEQHLDNLMDEFQKYLPIVTQRHGRFVFDLSEVEWISNQELLVFSGIFRYLILSNVSFKVKFLKDDWNEGLDRRRAQQIIQIWDVWRLGDVIPNVEEVLFPDQKYDQYFDINSQIVAGLKRKFKIQSQQAEIYNRFGVTPFVILPLFERYEDRKIQDILSHIYELNQATQQIIRKHNCELPFKNETLSLVITKELYENFLDHFQPSLFSSSEQMCFMSLTLKGKIEGKSMEVNQIQEILRRNFEEESIPELLGFFFDHSTSQFRNVSYLQLSFLDFGPGISNTLKEEYKKVHKGTGDLFDSKVLSYAFHPTSSKDPIEKRYLERHDIPRGLFDLLVIVKRYGGLIVARSNYGKVAYDFSSSKSMEEAVQFFGDPNQYFPGTLLSVYIPERAIDQEFDTTVIKPFLSPQYHFEKPNVRYISLFEILTELLNKQLKKEELYSYLFALLVKKLDFEGQASLIYLDFSGYELDTRIARKIIFFLSSDYRIHNANSIIVLNPPDKAFLDEIKKEMLELSKVNKQYRIHPTPFVYYTSSTKKVNIYWMGVNQDSDIEKLNQLLLELHDLRKTDFAQPDEIVGNVNYFDSKGNLRSQINSEQIKRILIEKSKETFKKEHEVLIAKYIQNKPGVIFLCTGNYYQHEYLQLYDALNEKEVVQRLSNALLENLIDRLTNLDTYKLLCVTSSSKRVAECFVASGHVKNEQIIVLQSYHLFYKEEPFQHIKKGDRIILICDVISTGYLTTKLEAHLREIDAELAHIAVLVRALDSSFEREKVDYDALEKKLTFLVDYPMKKYRRRDIRDKLLKHELEIVRINPYTNTPITHSNEAGFSHKVLLQNKEFIDLINESHVKAGYFKFNNLIHPYFFNMGEIMRNADISNKLMEKIFSRIPAETKKGIDLLFYPKNSGIQEMDFHHFSENIIRNLGLRIIELERFSTNEGWRFPHPAQRLNDLASGKKALILDDGSCSGESIVQMIDEVASLNVGEIVVVSIIGRVNDHKKDFFSRMKTLEGQDQPIPVSVYFGSHWHVPTYYIEDSPIIKERVWLEEVLSFKNLPPKIKGIAERVLDELTLKDVSGPNNRYLIKKRDRTSVIKDLILNKEEIGKITTYRFYREYFDFFNGLILSYDQQEKTENRYQKMELVCAVFLHEPELFEKVRNVLPDLTDKVEEFILTILFGNPTKVGKPRLKVEDLYYKWSHKNLFHLFFIVFKEEQLFKLLTSEKLEILVKDFCQDESDLSYILYRLLKYLPLDMNELHSKFFGGKVKNLIEVVSELDLAPFAITQLKIFRSFIGSLPHSKADFDSLISKIKNNYSKLVDDRYHNEYVLSDKQVLTNQLNVIQRNLAKKEPVSEQARNVKDAWGRIIPFIEDLLQLMVSFPTFFLPVNDALLNSDEQLRTMYGELNELILNENFTEVGQIKDMVDKLFKEYISEDSQFPEIFNNISISDLPKVIQSFVEQVKKEFPKINLDVKGQDVPSIYFPLYYMKEVVFKEIKANLRHADLSKPVRLQWDMNGDQIILHIENAILQGKSFKGGGKGLTKLNKLNTFPIPSKYNSETVKNQFKQILTFKLI